MKLRFAEYLKEICRWSSDKRLAINWIDIYKIVRAFLAATDTNRLTHNAHSGPKQPDNFDKILQEEACLGKYLKEKC